MINRKSLENSKQEDMPAIAIYNPLTQDQELMRPSMLPSFLAMVLSNVNRGQKNIKFFEIGKIYTARGEKDVLGVLMTGVLSDDWRQIEKKQADYYDLKGAIEQIFERRGIKRESLQFGASSEGGFSQGQNVLISIHDKPIGVIGRIEDKVLTKWDIKAKDVFFAQIGFDSLYRLKNAQVKYKQVSEFPVISRDISLAVKSDVTAQDVERTIYETAKSERHLFLSDLKFVELYEGDKIPKDHRGLIFSLTYQSRLPKTLRDEEVEQVHRKVCSALVNDLGVIQR
jgi:phenylalanyl-tRNA synthetase beta chain